MTSTRADVRAVSRCVRCGNTEVQTAGDVSRAVGAGWPRCCGAEMVLFPAADWAADAEPAGPDSRAATAA